MKILFLVPYPVGEAPSQRFRFEQYFGRMRQQGLQFKVSSFLDRKAWDVLYSKGNYLAKVYGILRGFFRRSSDMLASPGYDYVFIHREAAPLGPPLFEWMLAKIFRRRIIYDFDDSIWLPNVSESNRLFSKIKWYHKVKSICRWAHLISCGNDYLRDFALRFNKSVVVNPTVVDTENHYNQVRKHQPGKTVIGWTGTHSTSKYLIDIEPVLKKIEQNFDIEIRVISNAAPKLDLKSLCYIPWKKETEINDLLAFDIGIMPLNDDEWSKGKCGFKLIQYLALGIPAVSSPVGVNGKIVEHGKNGFLCATPDEWLHALSILITDCQVRNAMGASGRERIRVRYSTAGNAPVFLEMFA